MRFTLVTSAAAFFIAIPVACLGQASSPVADGGAETQSHLIGSRSLLAILEDASGVAEAAREGIRFPQEAGAPRAEGVVPLRTRRGALEQEIAQQQESREVLPSERQSHSAELDKVRGELQAMRKTLAEARAALQQARSRVGEPAADIAEAQAQSVDLRARLADIRSEVKAAETRRD